MTSKLAAAQQAIEEDDAIPAGFVDVRDTSSFDEGVGLRKFILDGYKRGKLNATDVATFAFHATAAGALGVADLAMSPQSIRDGGGNCAKHVRSALGVRAKSSFYLCKIPLWNHSTQERVTEDFPFHLPHDIFSELYNADPDTFNVEKEELAPNWFEHDVFVEHGPKAVPVTLYSDAVPHTKTDSFIAYYFSVMGVTQKRHLIASVRKQDCCRCGCRGDCTVQAILRVISWSYNVLASGYHPSSDFMGMPFSDEVRFNQRGFPLAEGFVGGLAEYRADLLEFVGALGFKRWQDNVNPCMLCGCAKHQLWDFPKTIGEYNWPDRDPDAYTTMCLRSIHKITVRTRAELKHLMGCMDFDWEFWGYSLFKDCAKFGLRRGQRLMVDGPIFDVHELQNVTLPADLSFLIINLGWASIS